jgi:hypothetical protein
LFHRLLEYNEDFEILQKLEGSNGNFSETELDELRPLLGLYGGEVEKRLPPGKANAEYVGERQMYWGRRRAETPYGSIGYAVADQAYIRYGLILDEILEGPSNLTGVDVHEQIEASRNPPTLEPWLSPEEEEDHTAHDDGGNDGIF